MKANTFFLIVTLALLPMINFAQSDEPSAVLRGYLVDRKFALDVLNYESITQKARQYGRERGLGREARESGYGVVSKGRFYPFDAKGNELALEVLRKTGKEAGIVVEARGAIPRQAASVTTTTTVKRGEIGRDRIGRPTYEPQQGDNQSYGTSVTLGGRRQAEEKMAVEELEEVDGEGQGHR